MSYILDALRKLEQTRQQDESLTFLTFQGQSPRKRMRHRLWPYLLVVVLMLNAGVIFWWIAPWQSLGKKSMTAEPTAVREVKPETPTSVPAPAADGVHSRASAEKTLVAPKEVKDQPRSIKRDIIATTRSTEQQPLTPKQAPVSEETSGPFEKRSPAPAVNGRQNWASGDKMIVTPKEVKEKPLSTAHRPTIHDATASRSQTYARRRSGVHAP